MGWLYNMPVELWLVDDGTAKRLKADGNLFSLGPLIKDAEPGAPYGFSGFRVHGPINRPDYFDEYVVFQGASYFRAVGRGQLYGLSARGLAVNTGTARRRGVSDLPRFWIEKPKPGARSIVIHALLDSVSTTGAYRFEVEPGEATIMDVEATLYPRRPLTHVGIAPLTSMYLHGPGHHRIDDDFRPAVHDSDGLAIYNGNNECIWRPLTNPRTLQTSAFIDRNLKGFGLCQRARSFHSFEDLEARYEKRPTCGSSRKAPGAPGYVELIEIPTEVEIHDNIAAYWKPANGPAPGTPFGSAIACMDGHVPSPGRRLRRRRASAAASARVPQFRRRLHRLGCVGHATIAGGGRHGQSRYGVGHAVHETGANGVRVASNSIPVEPNCPNYVWR